MKCKMYALTIGMIFSFTGQAHSGEIYKDDFSKPKESNLVWHTSNDFISKKFGDGACVAGNSNSSNSGFVYYVLPSKPTVFTVSSKITRTKANSLVGIAVNFSNTSNQSIAFLIGQNALYIGQLGDSIYGYASQYINSTENTLTVSRNGSVYKAFVNDRFVADYAMANAPGGDIAIVVPPKDTISFDDFLMTDTFRDGKMPTSFSDDFEGELKVDWTKYINSGTADVDSGKLKLTTANVDTSFIQIVAGVNLTNFSGKAAFVHRNGSTNSVYGFVLQGDSSKHQAIFVITAGKTFGAHAGSGTFNLDQKLSIRGAAYPSETGVKSYYSDTLEIIKRKGSQEYIFVANRDTLTRLTGINFPITKAGLYCTNSLEITVDNFSFVSVDEPSFVKRPLIRNQLKPDIGVRSGSFVFDPLGRAFVNKRLLDNKISSGIYFEKTQQRAGSILLIKNQK